MREKSKSLTLETQRRKEKFRGMMVMSERFGTRCPRCGERLLRGWDELSEEERMVVRRLPESAAYSPDEREAMHRWCTNCWHEETESAPYDA